MHQDLDLYDESRSLRFQGPLSRRYRTNVDLHWADLHVALLDNYCEYDWLARKFDKLSEPFQCSC